MDKQLWTIEFVNDKALAEFNELPVNVKAKMLEIIQLLKIYGNKLGRPLTAALGDGFFEIRAKSSEGIARAVYCYRLRKKILILTAVTKKQNKLPSNTIQIAKNRLKEYENERN